MKVLQTVVEVLNINTSGLLVSPISVSEQPVMSLIRLKKEFTYRLSTLFLIKLTCKETSCEYSFDICVVTDFTFSRSTVTANNLYILYSFADLAVKKKVVEQLEKLGLNQIISWPVTSISVVENLLNNAIVEMIYKQMNKNLN